MTYLQVFIPNVTRFRWSTRGTGVMRMYLSAFGAAGTPTYGCDVSSIQTSVQSLLVMALPPGAAVRGPEQQRAASQRLAAE
jgi:hypothetical protein